MSNSIDWSVYDSKINMDELRALSNKSSKKADFSKVPVGDYCVELSSLILTKSKSGSRMVTGRFNIVNGDFSGRCIYVYQVVQQRFQIDICNQFLRSLGSHIDVHFEGYDAYEELIKRIWLDVKDKNLYRLHYGRTPNGYDSFVILDVFDAAF